MVRKIAIEDLENYVAANILVFHQKRLERLERLELKEILSRKNPYLFKAKNILTAQDLIKTLLDAYLSSQEESIFGHFLEGLAIFVNTVVFQGKKSSAEGIDLEFERDRIKYIVSIKSGPNWGNNSQINKMRDNFKKARKILGANVSKTQIVAVNGCCYGKDDQPDKGDYLKLCGQRFWEFVSGDPEFYTKIIEPLGHEAKEKNEEFIDSYAALINNLTMEFGKEFCINGKIDWVALVKFNSAAKAKK